MISKYLCTALTSLLCIQLAVGQNIKINTVINKALTNNVITKDSCKTDSLMVQLMQQYPQYFTNILKNKKTFNVQFIYTQVDRGLNGMPNLTNHYFNVDKSEYFYPASTVKLPICLLALQKLNDLKDKSINLSSSMITGQAADGQTAVFNDPTTFDGKPTIANYIKKILIVSDNDAYNRLYEFLGRQYINTQLHNKGYKEAQILHRLQIPLSAEQNSKTNPISFLDYTNRILYNQPMQTDSTVYKSRTDSLGECFYSDDSIINSPMDFSGKNRISLESLHNILMTLVFPEKFPVAQRFNISDSNRNFMLKYMSELPTESMLPPYAADTTSYWPAFGKFLLFGAGKNTLPKSIRIFNKIGEAYGQLTDVAYIVDFDKKIEFFLSATIYCNSDGILNDDKYDYQNIGLPFLKHLGEVFYQYEINRPKKVLPDLSPFIFKYDGK